MVVKFSKNLVKNILNIFGLEIHRGNCAITHKASMHGCLERAISNGVNIVTIFDVGTAKGTPALYELFPNARHILIEPLEENIPALDCLVQKLDKGEYIIAAAASKPGNIVINVHPDLVGSSIYKEKENSNVNGVERTILAVTLDQICQDRDTEGPYLIKVDTQGAELEVMMGAKKILQDAELVILEVSLFEFFKGGPRLFDCINYMKNQGFVIYDIFDLQYRLLDGAMSQVDIAFVQEKSHLRKFHFYATKEQRNAQNKKFTQSMDKISNQKF